MIAGWLAKIEAIRRSIDGRTRSALKQVEGAVSVRNVEQQAKRFDQWLGGLQVKLDVVSENYETDLKLRHYVGNETQGRFDLLFADGLESESGENTMIDVRYQTRLDLEAEKGSELGWRTFTFNERYLVGVEEVVRRSISFTDREGALQVVHGWSFLTNIAGLRDEFFYTSRKDADKAFKFVKSHLK